jgi:tRNA 5-methylaminomethyl-2-thiouridine biosynthesis bifunctional protein
MPGVRFVGGSQVASCLRAGTQWQVRDAQGHTLVQSDRVVIAAGLASRDFAPALPLTAVRGQVAWGLADAASALPPIPVNGDGHLLARVPSGPRELWLAGATFDRGDADGSPRAADIQANRDRLARLHPAAAHALAPAFADGAAQTWAGVRCASTDRRPLVGPVDDAAAPGLWVCTAMGSRGLSFATLCAELLAARWHAEPLPVSAALANALDIRRSH